MLKQRDSQMGPLPHHQVPLSGAVEDDESHRLKPWTIRYLIDEGEMTSLEGLGGRGEKPEGGACRCSRWVTWCRR